MAWRMACGARGMHAVWTGQVAVCGDRHSLLFWWVARANGVGTIPYHTLLLPLLLPLLYNNIQA